MKQIHHLLLFITIALLFSACSGTSNSNLITIKGTIPNGTDIENVTLKKLDKQRTVIAETPILEDGTFSLEFEVAEADFFQFQLSDSDFIFLILQPGEVVEINISGVPMRENMKISGSEFTEQFIDLGDRIHPFEISQDSLERAYNSIQDPNEKNRRGNEFRGLAVQMKEQQDAVIREFISQNPSSLACLFFLNQLDINKELELFDKVNTSLLENYPNNVFVKELNYTVTAEKSMKVGMLAPDFEMESPDGTMIKVSDFRGKYLLLDFWASWCAPCRRENPKVVTLYKQFKDNGFEILGVSLDDNREKWLKAIDDDGLVWNHVSDLKKWESAGAKAYAVRAIPHTVLIGPDGKIIALKLRGNELKVKLQELMND